MRSSSEVAVIFATIWDAGCAWKWLEELAETGVGIRE
jgi:hypothetical protein